MTTVIDQLVVELGLDASKFTLQQREAFEAAKRLEAQQLKAAKEIEHGAGKASNALSATRSQALQLMAVLTGGAGVIAFGRNIMQADAAVGRLSRNINVSVSEISKWQAVTRIFGGDAQSMAQSFTQMSDAFAGMQIGQMSPLIADLRALGAAGGHVIEQFDSMDTKWRKLADNIKAVHDKDPATAGLFGRRLGLDPALFDAMISGNLPKVLQMVKELGGATKESADEAGRLEQNWNKLKLSIEGVGRAVSNKLNIAGWLNSFSEIFEGFSKGKVLKGSWADKIARIYNPGYEGGYVPEADRAGIAPGASVAAPSVGNNAFASQAEKEAYIRAEAARLGMNPNTAMAVAKSEGFNSFVSTIPGETSYGAFQLNVSPGGRKGHLGDQFRAKTGLDPADRNNERQGITFALEHAKKNGWLAFHGAKNTGIGRWDGINPGAGGSTTTTEVSIYGPITVQAPANENPNAWAKSFADAVKNRAFAAQANAGQN